MGMTRFLILLGIALYFLSSPLRSNAAGKAEPQTCGINEPQSSDCLGSATVNISIPLPQKRDKSQPASSSGIFGECEMEIIGESGTRPCSDIKLIVRSSREKQVQERVAVFDGGKFRFEDLTHTSYNLEAVSPKYEVSPVSKVVNPGQNVKIRVKVKPRR